MNVAPCLPENAPFSPEQRAWVNGYLAGLFAQTIGPAAAATPDSPATASASRPLRIAFGSQTGSAQGLARRIATEAARRGFQATVSELNAVAPSDLRRDTPCILVTSTWGDGDPPDNAADFWNRIRQDAAPKLEGVSYAVLGLGDRNYPEFCGAAKKLDERLSQLGAVRLGIRGECDTDYEAAASQWIDSLWEHLAPSEHATPHPATPGPTPTEPPTPAATTTSPAGYSRAHPFPARLKVNRPLNGAGSEKDTRHFEISLEGSGLTYEAGDALGVRPMNCPALVEELLAVLGFSGDESVELPGGVPTRLHAALLSSLALSIPGPGFLREVATRSRNSDLLALLEPARKAELDAWLRGRDVVDLARACPGTGLSPAEFAGLLRPLQPRLYSISSSPKAHPGDVHLTVAIVRYEAHGRRRKGVCSGWLADRVVPGETPVPVFVQTSHGFRLPKDPSVPVIMIGPGTGIAPFRAFLEERRATGATGRNWLFFGDQRRSCDFLYSEELTAWSQDGVLTHLDLAFSRDQAEKIYVQTRMAERAAELWSWLEAGAHLYVCGDARRMARDVDAALHALVASAGGRTAEQAAEYVAALKAAHRYQRDVY
ncbi:MAG: sulfite reductase subunit alpha [Verrucomicrobiota bacterium]